ncbi:MAG: colanic acid/amylovoran biosynthesis glycosyltransferase [Frankiaceae bacterium]|nr:colanic acid/amylovoran biosynthesis glycosyltransferase [Frankiaceae bacterium]
MTDSPRPVFVAASNVGGGISRHLDLVRTVVDIEVLELPETLSLRTKVTRMRGRLRERGSSLVVTHGVAAGLAARLRTRRLRSYRHVEIWHGDPFFLLPHRRIPYYLLARIGIAPDVQVFVSPALLEMYGDRRSDQLVLPNAVPPADAVRSAGGPQRRAVYMGRLSPEKGYEDLLAAWPQDAHERGWRLDVFGDGPLSVVHVPASVHLRGRTNDPLAEIGTADLVVIPSWTEASPYIALEALSLATPFIATRTGDMPDYLSSGCGWLVEARDVPGLRGALETAFGCSDEQLAAMGDRGRAWVRTERPFDAWLAAVAELYSTGRARP